ncbi:hypothetical protein C4577_07405 [Candidatus Parcubacteria bacterium]|nr:MAG: hypothetical protein C4577_07405 [Candidatus Parcubacteria bacterium]
MSEDRIFLVLILLAALNMVLNWGYTFHCIMEWFLGWLDKESVNKKHEQLREQWLQQERLNN